MADNATLPATGAGVATDQVTYSSDPDQHVQVIRPAHVTGSEGSKTVEAITQSTGSAVPAAAVQVGGSDGTNLRAIKVGTDGMLALPGLVVCSTDITRPADTTAYAIDDALANSTSAPTTGGFTLSGAARVSGGAGIITDLIITSSNDPATKLQGEIWIFDRAVTAVNDNAAFAVSDAEIKTCVAKVPFVLEDAGNNGFYHATNLNIGFVANGSADLRFLVRVKNAYTPASAEVLTVVAKILQVN